MSNKIIIHLNGKKYEIHNDEEICGHCKYLTDTNYDCKLFNKPIGNCLKCDECVVAYKKAVDFISQTETEFDN